MLQSGEQVLSLPGGGLENHSEKRLRTLLQMVRVSGLRLVQAGSLRHRLREEWGPALVASVHAVPGMLVTEARASLEPGSSG